MTGVIKSGASASHVRAFGRPSPVRSPEQQIDPELDTLRGEVARLASLVEEQKIAIAQHAEQLERARAQGEAAGREAGMKAADDARSALTAKLDKASAEALRVFSRELSSLERLAPLLAIEGLEKVFGASEDRAGAVLAVIGKQLDGLKAQAMVRVDVSSEDFPDEEQVAAAAAALTRSDIAVRTSPDLKSGDCRIKLQLGSMEVGLNQQWGRLRQLLASAAEPKTVR